MGGEETGLEDLKTIEDAWVGAMLFGDWDMVVFDEINCAIGYGRLDPEAVNATLSAVRRWSTSS